MNLLLDACTFLWSAGADSRLSAPARGAMAEPSNGLYLSAISVWEIVSKHAAGKLELSETPEGLVSSYREDSGIHALPFSEEAALMLSQLPPIHRDPFDRMLICQAIVEGLTILTPDPLIRQYPVRTYW